MIAAAVPGRILKRLGLEDDYRRFQWNVLASSTIIAVVVWIGLPDWGFCLFESTFGFAGPCCGVTTAMSGVLHGHWSHVSTNLSAASMAAVLLLQLPLRAISLFDRRRRIYGPRLASQVNLLLVLSLVASWLL